MLGLEPGKVQASLKWIWLESTRKQATFHVFVTRENYNQTRSNNHICKPELPALAYNYRLSEKAFPCS